jgi:tRNA threonylcarbamoyladenosine biosynthesis protein TsaB
VLILGVDTCDSRGSVAVRKDGFQLGLERHESTEDFSSWLIPAVLRCLDKAALDLRSVDVVAVASGPGSFTGLRVGLTAAKAWAELFGKRIVGISRLEVMAGRVGEARGYVAASFDGQRGQLFGGLYLMNEHRKGKLIDQEMVIAPDEFVKWVGNKAGGECVRWIGLDPDLLTAAPNWERRAAKGEGILRCSDDLAAGVAELGEERAQRGEYTDALELDANYVRRSDAEIFWKDPGSHERR